MNNLNNRNQLLDMMRFFAALCVAFFHFNQPIVYIDNPYRNLLKLGYLGVPVFFVISGYCIIYSAEQSKNWKDFIVRRFFRIYPPYLLSLTITFAIILLLKLITGLNSVAILPKNVYSIFCTFALLTAPITHVPGVNWVYWTLSLEIFFYLFTCIARIWPERLRPAFFVAISIISWLIPLHHAGILVVFKFWPIFSLGISLYYIQKQTQLILAILLTVLNLATINSFFLLGGEPLYFYASVFTMLVVFLSFKYRMKKNWLSIAGDYSYSVYLLHVPIGVFVMGKFKTPYIQTHIAANILFDIFCYLVTFSLSYLTFKWVELPSIALGKSVAQMFGDKKEIAATL